MTRVRVLVVDDHPVVRAGLCGMLAALPELEVVGEAQDGEAAVERALALAPDVVLMDLRLPRLSGVAATARIRAARPACRVLVLTTYDGDADILRAIEAGAQGYLLKDIAPDELLRAVRATARGESIIAPAIAARLMKRAAEPPGEPLSRRELSVLRRVARGESNKAIAADLRIGEATVKTHLLHLFGKLGVDDRTAAVVVALRRGILDLSIVDDGSEDGADP